IRSPRPPSFTLFPYTTLFRSDSTGLVRVCCANFSHLLGDIRKQRLGEIWSGERIKLIRDALRSYNFDHGCGYCKWKIAFGEFERSEEHTSELQSRENLVCRLL